MNPIKVVIVDDETLARENIEALIQDDPEVTIVGQCANGQEAIDAVRRQRTDLVFLDVQMPGLDGFEVLSRLKSEPRPHVVFITAYDQYAIKAFDVNAMDYLLKPFSRQRFATALAKAKAMVRSKEHERLNERIDVIINTLQELRGTPSGAAATETPPASPPADSDAATWSGRLLFRSDGEIHVLSPEEIRWIESEGDYVKIHAGPKTKLVRMALVKIMQKLDPAHFVRIHRSTIVNLTHVRKVSPALYGEYTVELAEGARLKVSRTYVHELKSYL
ncbi:MAG TPA: LytTR family DNA-binding domain-containing protein [Candidatus Didemnitutus sp.]|nr:LytTR family DNA-binding domain-containing protein [Candidatus Didemnitutus sp.]